ncbi:MAG TPA: hypothetical protein VGH19_16355 [Verrucomicrobiae bacterium]
MAEPLSKPQSPAPDDLPSLASAVATTIPAAEANAVEPSPVKQLSKEEQMAAFEEDLKYNDWGHQPC